MEQTADRKKAPHLPSARKFRPRFFSQVKGQEAIATSLQSAIVSEKMPGAYLFSGLRGCGKTTFARLIAASLNCTHRTSDGEPCNACSSCKEMWSGQSLNCIEIDGASNRGIDDIRKLQENVSLKASGGGYKVYIIDEVHMLTKEAFNALLKTLEEPPESVLFIFATTEPHKVPDTVLSRCQCFSLKHMSEAVITEHLEQIAKQLKVASSKQCLALIANAAQGSMRDSLSIFDQALAFHHDLQDPKIIFDLLHLPSPEILSTIDQAIVEGNIPSILDAASRVCEQGTHMESWLDQLLSHYRNHLLASCSKSALNNLPTAEQAALYARPIFSTATCLEFLDIVSGARKTLSSQTHQRLHLELTLLALVRSVHSMQQAPNVEPPLKASNPATQKRVTSACPAPSKEDSPQKTASLKPSEEVISTPQAPPKPEEKKTVAPDVSKKKRSELVESTKPKNSESRSVEKVPQARYDTILQFAAREMQAQIEEV